MQTGGVVVGSSANVDYTIEVKHRPHAGETVLADDIRTFTGGKGANQAVAARRAGAAVTMIGCVGDDSAGKRLRAQLAGGGIVTTPLKTISAAPTGTAFVTVTPEGDNAIIVAGGANHHRTESELDRHTGAIRSADVLCVQLEITLAVAEHACRLGREHGTRVVRTPAPTSLAAAQLLPLADVVVLNLGEAQALTGSRQSPQAAAEALRELGARATVITLGASGAFAVDQNGHRAQIDAPPVRRVVDTTAVGDTLAGYVAARLACGDTLRQAVKIGVAAASLSVTRAGAQDSIPSIRELPEFASALGCR